MKTLDDWLRWLETLHPQAIAMGLERVQQLAQRMDLHFDGAKVVTVGGTNGKGSCVATLESLLLASGEQVGAYTSPHFLRYNERVRVNGCEVSDAQLCDAFATVEAVRGNISLTYFEYGTMAALVLFKQAQVTALVLEVGLGGRLDAVNIIDSTVAIVTTIDIDHQEWLGDDRETIGFEKAGIFRPQRIAICGDRNPPASVVECADKITAKLSMAGRDFDWLGDDVEAHHAPALHSSSMWQWRGTDPSGAAVTIASLPPSPLPRLSMAAALQAYVALGYSPAAINVAEALSRIRLVGRCQEARYGGKSVLLDVAHNPAAAQYLVERLGADNFSGRTLAVFGVMTDKDAAQMLAILKDIVAHWYLSGLPGVARATPVAELGRQAQSLGLACSTWDTAVTGFHHAVEAAGEQDRVIVIGSFYTVAAVLDAMAKPTAAQLR